ncbi:hypothetical protein FQN51_006505 [Onygenales sp. PD_10]|nr:hypothetical protein FQN51_006505 [Onygenales sp. PD_10]
MASLPIANLPDLDFQTPLIFDESLFDLSDPEESRFAGTYTGGLLAKSGELISMAAYEKPPQVDLFDYDPTRALHDTAGFSAYAQPPYVTHLYPSALESHTIPDDDSVHYVTNDGYSGSDPFDLPRSPALDFDPRQVPEVTSFTPLTGHEGSKLSVYLQSPYDLCSPAPPIFSLLFGTERCEGIVTPLSFDKPGFHYELLVDTPPFAATGSPSFAVPLQMIMADNDGQGAQAVHVGVFTYDHNPQSSASPIGLSRKRRLSDASDETSRSTRSAPVKQLRIKEPTNSFAYSESLSGSPYSPYLPTPSTANAYPVQYHPVSPRPSLRQYTGTPVASQPMIKASSPLASSWSPSFSTVNPSARSPGLAMTPVSHTSGMPSPIKTMNPTLIRTSTMQHSLAGTTGPNQPFNPYAMYPSKAVLKLNGDLDSMAEKWTQEEQTSKRRLVHFTRRQNGSTIHADFKPVAPADRVPNSICISCIYWEGKKECYVTSVDTIYLLESLVGVRFTVEEKNRIRRNLEGFRPLTVSKAKPESEDFFKVIMGFPNPKPRNIEKDVKVFPWKILSHALKKIIGKYLTTRTFQSASYSSTAGALPTPINSNFTSTSASDASVDPRTASPRSLPESAPSSTYGASLATGHLRGHKSLDNSSMSGPVDLRLMVTNSSRHYASLPAPYPYQSMNQPQLQQLQAVPVGRSSWDFGAFVNTSPATSTPTQGLNYPRQQSHIVTSSQDFTAPPVYSFTHPTSEP